jgi:hypothetical protein
VTARVLLCVSAIACAAWLGASLHAANLHRAATNAIITPGTGSGLNLAALEAGATDANLVRSVRLLERSRHWAPLQADIPLEAQMRVFATRRRGPSIRQLRDLVEREPDNVDGWSALAGLTFDRKTPVAREARRRLLELSPPPGSR